MTRRSWVGWLGVVALSGALGLASVWPAPAASSMLLLARTGIVALSLGLFFVVLPRRMKQPSQIFAAMLLGVLVGYVLRRCGEESFVSDYLGIFGALFILLLKLVIIPLIFVSIVCGVASMGDVRKVGALGAKALAYYFSTTAVAVLIGLACTTLLQPGAQRADLKRPLANEAGAATLTQDTQPSLGVRIQEDILPSIVQNPIMAGQNPLVVIFFGLLLGAALAAMGEEALPAVRVFQVLDRAFITLVLWIMCLAPVGVFALMAKAIAAMGIGYIATLAKYCFTVVLGLGLHFSFLVFVLLPLLARVSPWRYLRGMTPAMELAFSTSSSSAVLPVAIDCATRRVGADQGICNFMLPVGATINMDGTALYQAVAALFIAEVYGVDLGFVQQVSIFMTAVLVSVGAAGIPGASVGLMGLVLASAGIPVEGIGIIVGVDRFLDMCRTVVNITGDSVGSCVVSRSEGRMGAPWPETVSPTS